MSLFVKNNQPQMVSNSPSTVYRNRYNRARSEMLFVIGLTVLNIALLFLSENGFYFLISAYVPYAAMAVAFKTELSVFTFLKVAAVAITFVVLGVYLLLYFLSKKKPGALIATLVLFSIDTAVLLAESLMSGSFAFDMLLDILFHALVIVYLVMGLIAASKLKKLGEDVYSKPVIHIDPVASGQPANAEGTYERINEPEHTDDVFREEKTDGFAVGFNFKTEPKCVWDGKGKVRLSAEYNGLNVNAVRKFGCTQLIINESVYDTFDSVVETPYSLGAEVNGTKFMYSQDAFGNASLLADGVCIASGKFAF